MPKTELACLHECMEPLNWLTNYLYDRNQYVLFNQHDYSFEKSVMIYLRSFVISDVYN